MRELGRRWKRTGRKMAERAMRKMNEITGKKMYEGTV